MKLTVNSEADVDEIKLNALFSSEFLVQELITPPLPLMTYIREIITKCKYVEWQFLCKHAYFFIQMVIRDFKASYLQSSARFCFVDHLGISQIAGKPDAYYDVLSVMLTHEKHKLEAM